MTDIRGLPPIMVGEPDPGVALGVEEGLLCQLLHSPEFNLFPNSAVFESNFIQVRKTNDWWVDTEDWSTTVVLGVTSSVPCLPLPNIFLMAKITWPQGHLSTWNKSINAPTVTLSRILPMKFVELMVYDKSQRILRVRTVTEKIYYMKLHPKHPTAVFHFWIRLVNILQKGLSITSKDPSIHVNHCLVPKTPSTIILEESTEYDPSDSQARERLMLLMAPQGHEAFSDLSLDLTTKQDQLKTCPTNNQTTKISKAEIEEEAKYNSGYAGGNQDKWDFQQCSGYNSSGKVKLSFTGSLNHGLWEQENPSGVQPPSRLSTLAASTQQVWPQP
ncbi:Golgi-associated RAB2 interactor protein 1A isoform X2 [Monodelphis domestica]|uniref:Golgi-associated RAB2 interactor protein 1A isoform X2 n=1 Tax=Monodelphis domestica TaxID=13616 RepID=UPI0004435D1F|nr:Golgi-associated RAB2 interactor protein 1A isoform X2 [Monodelphis domestica]